MTQGSTASATRGRLTLTWSEWGVDVVAGGGAAVVLVAMAGLRAVANVPVRLPVPLGATYGHVETAALVVPAMALVVIGLSARDALTMVGPTTVGVFGLLTAVTPTAGVPAAGAIVTGGTIAVWTRLTGLEHRRQDGVVAGLLLAGVAVSLGSTSGLLGVPARTVGSGLAMLGVAATPFVVRPNRVAWLTGGVAFAVVLGVGLLAPFVTGGIVLVVAAAVGLPLLLVAAGTAGGVVSIAAGVSSRRPLVALGMVCLLAGGVASTVPRAVAVILGLVLLFDRGGFDG